MMGTLPNKPYNSSSDFFKSCLPNDLPRTDAEVTTRPIDAALGYGIPGGRMRLYAMISSFIEPVKWYALKSLLSQSW